MPWKESDIVSERMQFLSRLQAGERMSDLCREFGITRTTGYKFKRRYERYGLGGIPDESRAPKHPRRTSEEICEQVVALRKKHPTWGPPKLKKILTDMHPGIRWPAPSTIGAILDREGLIQKRRKRRRSTSFRDTLGEANKPNDVWCIDYKGQFRLGNGKYCYPLTITDQFARFVHGCEGFDAIRSSDARAVLEETFDTYGLPLAMRSDNGAPFASTGLFGLSRLSAWFLALGIQLQRIKPGCPQQNGRHERMHRTLKAEVTRPAAPNLLQQQQRFDSWVHTFNHHRPHEALGQVVPATVYQRSERPYATPRLEYPLHDDVVTVTKCGHIRLLRRRKGSVFLSSALAGFPVGVRELDSGDWLLTFAQLDLGTVNPQTMEFARADQTKSKTEKTKET